MLNLNCMTCIASNLGAFEDRPYKYAVKDSIPELDLEAFKSRRKVIIYLSDGSRLKGRYYGLENIPKEEYAEKYTKCLELLKGEIVLPALGDTISLSFTTSEQDEAVIFGGFGHRLIMTAPVEAPDSNRFMLEYVKSISVGGGSVIETETIRDLMHKGKIPLLSAIHFRDTLANKKLIPIDEIEMLKIEENDLPGFEGTDPGFMMIGDLIYGIIIWYFFIR